MKIKLDENLPAALAKSLQSLGHDVETVINEGLKGRHDSAIWDAAQEESRFLITQDLDFSDLRRFAPGIHAGVLLVRLREPSRQNLIALVAQLFRTESVERWHRCFVIATEKKTRVLKPAK